MNRQLKDRLESIAVVVGTLFFVAGIFGGWCANIVKLAHIASDPITGMFVLRLIGIVFFPLGIVLGYC